MGKKELIEKWESKKGASAYKLIESPLALTKREIYVAGYGVARKEILDDLKQLDEPKKKSCRSLLRILQKTTTITIKQRSQYIRSIQVSTRS